MSGCYGPDGDCEFCHRHDCDNGDNPCNERQAAESENIEECSACGEEFDRDGVGVVPNDSPQGVMGYFCNENCQVSAAEVAWERRQSV